MRSHTHISIFTKAPSSRIFHEDTGRWKFFQGTEGKRMDFRTRSIVLLVCDYFLVTLDPKHCVSTYRRDLLRLLTHNSPGVLSSMARWCLPSMALEFLCRKLCHQGPVWQLLYDTLASLIVIGMLTHLLHMAFQLGGSWHCDLGSQMEHRIRWG